MKSRRVGEIFWLHHQRHGEDPISCTVTRYQVGRIEYERTENPGPRFGVHHAEVAIIKDTEKEVWHQMYADQQSIRDRAQKEMERINQRAKIV